MSISGLSKFVGQKHPCYDLCSNLVIFDLYACLQAEIAKAWKVIREEPIVVRLHLSLSRYLDATGMTFETQ